MMWASTRFLLLFRWEHSYLLVCLTFVHNMEVSLEYWGAMWDGHRSVWGGASKAHQHGQQAFEQLGGATRDVPIQDCNQCVYLGYSTSFSCECRLDSHALVGCWQQAHLYCLWCRGCHGCWGDKRQVIALLSYSVVGNILVCTWCILERLILSNHHNYFVCNVASKQDFWSSIPLWTPSPIE